MASANVPPPPRFSVIPSDRPSCAKLFTRAAYSAYVVFLYYLEFIVQACTSFAYYIGGPIVYLLGYDTQEYNDILYEVHERFVVFSAFTLARVKTYFYGDFVKLQNKDENFIIISNHQTEADYFLMAAAMEKTGSLRKLRHVMKESLIWVPYVGGYLVSHGSLFVNRDKLNWKRFDRNCQNITDNEISSCIMLYPEGTTWNNAVENPGVLKHSVDFAKKEGQEPLKHMLYPRHKGFARVINKLQGHLDAVYDVTYVYSSSRDASGKKGMAPTVTEFVNGFCPEVYMHLERIDISKIPTDEEGAKAFLLERFRIKEKLLDAFYTTGSLPGKGVNLPIQSKRNTAISILCAGLSVYLGLTSGGLTLLPIILITSLVIGYANVIYHFLFR